MRMRRRNTSPIIVHCYWIWVLSISLRSVVRILALRWDRPKGLTVCAINHRLAVLSVHRSTIRMLLHLPSISQMRIGCVCWHKRMRLRGHWRENAFLVKSYTVGTTPVWRRVETVTPNLFPISSEFWIPRVNQLCVSCSIYMLSPFSVSELVG